MCLNIRGNPWIQKWFVRDKTIKKPILDIQSFNEKES